MIFVDASALCAILLDEPEGPGFTERLAGQRTAVTSPISVWETVRALQRETGVGQNVIRERVQALLDTYAIVVVSIGLAEGEIALDAHARFGKGVHPARLNMGDCFAYAGAGTQGARLLYKGDDFALTDIEPA